MIGLNTIFATGCFFCLQPMTKRCSKDKICHTIVPEGENSIIGLQVTHFIRLCVFNLGQVWYLIVSIPDLCNLTYFF